MEKTLKYFLKKSGDEAKVVQCTFKSRNTAWFNKSVIEIQRHIFQNWNNIRKLFYNIRKLCHIGRIL